MTNSVELAHARPIGSHANVQTLKPKTDAFGSGRTRRVSAALSPVGIAVAVLAISLLHYGTRVHFLVLHEIFKRLYYLPIVTAAVTYGSKGGLATSFLASVLFLPHIVIGWRGWPEFTVEQYGELILFNVVAGLTGILADRVRAERNRYREAAAELQEAYCHLQARAEERLRVDRLVTLGRIASGIAHEIRNPLGSLLGCIEILETEFPRAHPKREFFTIARKEMRRLDGVIAEFLEFAEPAPPSSSAVDLNQIVKSTARLARPSLVDRTVTIHLPPCAVAAFAAADAEQVERALLNVILAGTWDARGTRVDVDILDNSGGPAIRIRIPGAEHLLADSDVFDPFSLVGRGHGLALAAARRLVENQHGTLRAQPIAGALEFVLALPAASQPVMANAAAATGAPA